MIFRLSFLLCFLLPMALQAEPIRIGIITDLSGGMAAWGKQTVVGAEIARDEIAKAGGVLTLIVEDHQLRPKNAVSAFKKLTEIDKVDAIYSEFTPTTLAIAPLSNTTKIPIIYSAAATSPLSVSPFIFKSYLDYVQGCTLIGAYWKKQGLTKVGILKASLEFGALCADGLKQVYPDAVEVEYTPSDSVSAQVLKLKSRNVQAVVNATFEPDFLRMLKAMNDLAWSPQLATQSDAITGEVHSQFPKVFDRLVVFALPTLPESFIAKVKAKDPANNLISISAAGLAYLHVKQLFSARNQCKNEVLDCKQHALERSAADQIIGFKKWNNHVADFAVRLHGWKNDQEQELEDEQ